MFYKWFVSKLNNEQVLYLFVENNYEFAQELFNKNNKESIYKKINDYIKSNNILYNGNKVFLVSNNLIIGSVDISKDNEINIRRYIDIDNVFEEDIEIIDVADKKISKKEFNYNDIDEYIMSLINTNILDIFEKEALKTIVIILRTNILKDIEKYGHINGIKKNSPTNPAIINIINETKKMYLKTNNSLNYIPILFTQKKHIQEINTMSKAGYNCFQIISHYYPNTKISTIQ